MEITGKYIHVHSSIYALLMHGFHRSRLVSIKSPTPMSQTLISESTLSSMMKSTQTRLPRLCTPRMFLEMGLGGMASR